MRYSRQREMIRTYMKDRHDHPTADQVYAAMRKEFPSISLGTVHRNLMQLVDAGELQIVDVGDHSSHFDGTTDEHQHFRCMRCGRVHDVRGPSLSSLTSELDLSSLGHIDSYTLCFNGICNDCLAALSKDHHTTGSHEGDSHDQ